MDPIVIFSPSGKRGRVPAGTSVLAAARRLGVDLDSVCGGRGICGRCQIAPGYGEFPKHGVRVAEDALCGRNAVEDRYGRVRGLAQGRRLGCQATVRSDAVIDVPPESQVHKQVIRKAAAVRDITMDPATRQYYVEVREPDMHEPSGDLERLKDALAKQWGIDTGALQVALPTLGKLQALLREGEWAVTVALHRGHADAHERILDIGCGEGTYDYRIAWRGARVFGFDLNQSQLRRAMRYHKTPDTAFLSADACAFPLKDEQFDTVMSLCVFEHLPNDRETLRESWRVLRRGGRILLTLDSLSLPGIDEAWRESHCRKHLVNQFYTHQSIEALLAECGFKLERYHYMLRAPADLALIKLSYATERMGAAPAALVRLGPVTKGSVLPALYNLFVKNQQGWTLLIEASKVSLPNNASEAGNAGKICSKS